MSCNPIQIIDSRFRDLTFSHVALEPICTGHMWTEGPVWFGDQQVLVFSDIRQNTLYRWDAHGGVVPLRRESNFANGNTRDLTGRLISCEHGTRQVTRTELNGTITTLASHYEDKPLNSPNDVVVDSKGSVWFTDPSYGIMGNLEGNKGTQELASRYVFCLNTETGELKPVLQDFNQPNGLAFSVDEKILYVAESGKSHDDTVPSVVRAYDVNADNTLTLRGDFAQIEPGVPDGLRVDQYDNVWISAADGVHCFAPDGTILGKILVPETVANLTFGGPRNNQLFITATTSVYAIFVNTSSAIADR